MTIAQTRSAQRGFTLIELLIVVIILAILAAIVIPQFANTTSDAREGALDANLSTMRSAIELYKIQHKNVYPAAVKSTGNGTVPACAAGSAGTGADASGQAFLDQLTMASDAAGNTCAVASTGYPYGPYFRGAVPAEPINNKGTAAADITVSVDGAKLDPTVVTGGWAFDAKSGQLVMNSSAVDSKGVKYSAH